MNPPFITTKLLSWRLLQNCLAIAKRYNDHGNRGLAKRIAELDTKMTGYGELGRLLKIRKEQEALIPKVVDKKKKLELKENLERYY